MKKRMVVILAAALALTGCAPAAQAEAPGQPWVPETVGVYQAETGRLLGNTRVSGGVVTGFEQDGDSSTLTVEVPETGFYDLEFWLQGIGGYKENYVLVDGQRMGTVSAEGGPLAPDTLRRVYLEAGSHEVGLQKYWGYINWDKVAVLTSEPFDESVFDVSAKLVNEHATDNAKRLFSYLCDSYGEVILSGQYCDTGANGWENMKIAENNGGKYPAVLGLDMGYYSQTGVDHGVEIKTTEQAIAYWENGGIVTLCWHWLAPEQYITGTWYSAFRPEEVKMDLAAMVNGEDPEGLALLKQDIDNVAQELLRMQQAGVPVLWRPLHEASGGWFWWGKEGSETFVRLWRMMYDRYTNHFGLNNLIWVLGYSGNGVGYADWYPGDEYVDITGADSYDGGVQRRLYDQLAAVTQSKPFAFHECGTNPTQEELKTTPWVWFMTWHTNFVTEENTPEALKALYTSEYVITKEELPSFRNEKRSP